MNSNDEKITFLKWWEGKRILFNVITLLIMVAVLFLYGGLSPFRFIPFKFYLFLILFINIFYSISSIIGFIFKLTIGTFNDAKLNSFFQNENNWQLLFRAKVLIFLLLLFLLIKAGESPPPPRANPFLFH